MKASIKIIASCVLFILATGGFGYAQNPVNADVIKPIEKKDKKSKKLKNKDLVSQQIASLMLKKQIRVNITNVISSIRSSTRQEGYPISLINSKFTCDLPFYGQGGMSAYGSGHDLYIKSNNQEVAIESSSFNEKKGYYLILFPFNNEGEKERWQASMKIFTNGKVSLEITSDRRSSMSYLGTIIL